MDSPDAIFGATPANGEFAKRAEAAQAAPPAMPAPSAADAPRLEEAGIPTTPNTELANRVMSVFRVAWDHRNSSGVTARLDYCLRTHRNRFSQEQETKLREMFPGTDIPEQIRSRVTSVKNRALRANLVELVSQAGEPLFRIESSPVPDDGGEALMKAVRGNLMEVAGLIDELERQGVTDEQIPPEALDHLKELVEGTFERRYDDIAGEVEGEARQRARRMAKKVWDIWTEGGNDAEFMKSLDNFCVFGTCVTVGPVMRNVARNEVKTSRDGVKTYRRVVRCIPKFEAVNPLDCYPAPGAVEVEDGPLCITVRYTGEELFRLASSARGRDVSGGGWMGTVVNDILARHDNGARGVKLNAFAFDPDRRICEGNGFDDSNDCTFEGVRCFMPMRGSALIDIGVTKNLDGRAIEAVEWYRTESIVVDNRVIYVCIHPEEMGVPVSKACCYTVPGSWWGGSIADQLGECQCVLDNTAKSMLLNMSMTSAPSGWVSDLQRLADKSPNALKWKAGKIFGFTNGGSFGVPGNSGPPMGVFAIPSTLNDALAVWKAFQQQADLDSGLPSYSEGQSAGASGALRTAQGLNTFVENMMRGAKSIVTNLDKGMIAHQAQLIADWVLVYDTDQSLKGDVFVRSTGLMGRILKVQRDAMRLQMLNLCLNSEVLLQAIGVKGILEMFRPSLEGLDLNPDDILPSKAKIEEQDALMRIAQMLKAAGGAADAAQEPAGGMQSGVAPVEQPAPAAPGGVAERRGAA
ncbi:MAG: hypothetical protein IIY62_00215 [Kiritimatiellae bacterium]|nr:hypothetical protein [Kiritimatiellia bacterium]